MTMVQVRTLSGDVAGVSAEAGGTLTKYGPYFWNFEINDWQYDPPSGVPIGYPIGVRVVAENNTPYTQAMQINVIVYKPDGTQLKAAVGGPAIVAPYGVLNADAKDAAPVEGIYTFFAELLADPEYWWY